MRYIGILGSHTECNEHICDKLERMGYKLNSIYSTKEQSGMILISETKFKELVDENKMILLEERDNTLYGILNPYGVKKYVSILPIEYFEILKNKYGEQMSGFYVATNNDEILDDKTFSRMADDGCTVMIYDTSYDINSLVAEILKRVR